MTTASREAMERIAAAEAAANSGDFEEAHVRWVDAAEKLAHAQSIGERGQGEYEQAVAEATELLDKHGAKMTAARRAGQKLDRLVLWLLGPSKTA